MISTTVFDLGGVVVPEPEGGLWERILSDLSGRYGLDRRALEYALEERKNQVQTGKESLKDFYRSVLASLHMAAPKPENLVKFHLKAYSKYCGKYDRDVLDLIEHLKERYHVVCLTNTEPEVAEFNRKRGLFDYFERAFISSETGLAKPDPESYRMLLNELDIGPEEAVFIDDNEVYVKAAEKIGIHGIVYRDVNQLKGELNSFGVF